MKRVHDFLKKANVYYLATFDGDQPRVRPFGTINEFEGKLYIQTGKIKPTSHQLAVNPKAEICAFTEGAWIRVECELIEDDRLEAKKSMRDADPNLPGTCDGDAGHTQVCDVKTVTATETPAVPAPNPKPQTGQMSMFDLFDEPVAEAPESPVKDEETIVEQVPTEATKEPPRLSLEHIGGFDVDTETGEVIEPEPPEDPYADTKLMYRIFLLLDQSIETVK